MFNVEHWKYLKGSVCPQRLHGWESSPIRNNFCFIWLDLWFLTHLPGTSIRYIFLSLVAKELSTFSTHGLIFSLTWYLNVLFQPVIGAFPASPLLMIFYSILDLWHLALPPAENIPSDHYPGICNGYLGSWELSAFTAWMSSCAYFTGQVACLSDPGELCFMPTFNSNFLAFP